MSAGAKTAEVKPATSARSGPGKPFFTGSGVAMQEQRRPAFFNYGQRIQTKLNLGQTGDKYEQEADRTADKVVMRLADHREPSKDARHTGPGKEAKPAAPPIQTKRVACEEKEQKQKEKENESPEPEKIRKKPIFDSSPEPPPAAPPDDKIQRCEACDKEKQVQKNSNEPSSESAVPAHVESRLNSSKGGGSPLPAGTRDHMESSFGADFSAVRVHTDGQAAEMNKSLHAQAFAHGSDIYFDKGKFDTGSKAGQHLLAHELTHVVQQGGAEVKTAPAPPNVVNPPTAIPQKAPPNVANPPAAKHQQGIQAGQPAKAAPAGQATKATPASQPGKATPGGPADKATPGGGPTKAAPGGPATKAAASPKGRATGATPKAGFTLDPQLQRLAKVHNSVYKTVAMFQAAQLEHNTELCRHAINLIAVMRTREIRQWFAAKKNSINQFFLGTGFDLLNTIQQKQLEFMAMTIAAMVKVQTFVSTTEQSILTLGNQIHDSLSGFVDQISSAVSDGVNAVADKITGFISSIPIPDVPGAAAIRDTVTSLVNRAARAVTGLITTITGAIQDGLTKVTQLITGIITTIGEFIQQMLTSIFGVIMQIQVTLFTTVRQIGNTILSYMTNFLHGTLFPIMQQGEDYLVDQVDEARLIRLMQLEDNQEQVLKAMVDVLDPKTKPTKEGAAKTTKAQRLLYFKQVEEVGVQRNAEIVAKFLLETSSFFLIAIHKLIAFSEYIYTAWQAAVRQFKENISAMWNTIAQKVKDFVSEEIDKIKTMITKLVDAFVKIGALFVKIVTKVKDAVVKLASTIADSIWSRIKHMVSQLVSGSVEDAAGSLTQTLLGGAGSALASMISPGFEPQPQPQFVPQLQPQSEPDLEEEFAEDFEEFVTEVKEVEPVAEEVEEVVAEELPVVEESALVAEETETAVEAVAEGWEVVLIVVVVIIILVLVALVVYLLYLLIEELLKPKPDPEPIPIPEPEPVPKPDPDDPDEEICRPGEIFDPSAPSGLLGIDPITVIWYKPLSVYENPLFIGGRTYFMTRGHQPLPPPFQSITIGVEAQFLPTRGKILNMFSGDDRGVSRRFVRQLLRAGFSWRGLLGRPLSPDHVQDLFWNGFDEFENLWPLDQAYNARVGSFQNLEQEIYFRPDPGRPCAVELTIREARRRFPNMSLRRYVIVDIMRMP